MLAKKLTRRKDERATGEKVNVQMKNRLPAVAVCIDDDAIAVVGKTFFARDFGGGQKQMSERFLMIFFGFVERREMFARNISAAWQFSAAERQRSADEKTIRP